MVGNGGEGLKYVSSDSISSSLGHGGFILGTGKMREELTFCREKSLVLTALRLVSIGRSQADRMTEVLELREDEMLRLETLFPA